MEALHGMRKGFVVLVEGLGAPIADAESFDEELNNVRAYAEAWHHDVIYAIAPATLAWQKPVETNEPK